MISAITSNTQNNLQNWQLMQQRRQDFQNLGSSIQSGNMSGAQQAYSDLQTMFANASSSGTPGTSSTSAVSSNSAVQQDFAAIGQDLSSGNMAQAQKDYTQMKNDVQSVLSQNTGMSGMHHHGHHHMHLASSSDSSSTPTATSSTDAAATNTLNSAASSLFAQYANPSASASNASNLLSMIA